MSEIRSSKRNLDSTFNAVVKLYDKVGFATSESVSKIIGTHQATARERLKLLEKANRITRWIFPQTGAVLRKFLWTPKGKEIPEKYKNIGYARA